MADEPGRITDAIMVAVAEQLKASAGQTGNSSVAISVNAGGIGVWLSLTACAVMLVAASFLAGSVYEARAQLREHGHQLNAIYRVAPSVEREVRARLEDDARLREQIKE